MRQFNRQKAGYAKEKLHFMPETWRVQTRPVILRFEVRR